MFYCLLTVTGPDQPELLHKFSETLVLMEGVILEKQHIVLAGQSSALYKVFLPPQYLSFARNRFAEFERQGLSISIQELPPEPPETADYLELILSGQYKFYLCHDLRNILESHGARVEQINLNYHRQNITADMPFRVRVLAALSRPVSSKHLSGALNRLAPDLKVQLNIFKAGALAA